MVCENGNHRMPVVKYQPGGSTPVETLMTDLTG